MYLSGYVDSATMVFTVYILQWVLVREYHYKLYTDPVAQVVQLSEDVNEVDIRLFAGLCALAERMLRAFTL